MYQTEIEESFASTEIPDGLGLWYDAERLILEGAYLDEVTAYRARRRWIQTFETNFLLEGEHDFGIKVVSEEGHTRFFVRCTFLSACGRYAFWRLTHRQAPEVQFLLETAHLPFVTSCPPRIESFVSDECEELRSLLGQAASRQESQRSTFERIVRRTQRCVQSIVRRLRLI